MRVYHFLPERYGIDDLKQRRLKVAEFNDLNDPFEVLSVQLSDREARRRFAAWRDKALVQYGLLCFSTSWRDPVLWSHYANSHKGLCLGFDVPDSLLLSVIYLKSRSSFADLLPSASNSGTEPGALFHTKFEHWKYEDEVRRVVRLDEAVREGGLFSGLSVRISSSRKLWSAPVVLSIRANCNARSASRTSKSLLPRRVLPSEVSELLRRNAGSRES